MVKSLADPDHLPLAFGDLGSLGTSGGHRHGGILVGRSWVIACAMVVMWACGSSAPRVDGETDWEPAKKKDIRVSLIKTLIDSGAYTSSVPLLRQGLAENPKDPRLHYLMGSVEVGAYDLL